jgi:hypothetical protein
MGRKSKDTGAALDANAAAPLPAGEDADTSAAPVAPGRAGLNETLASLEGGDGDKPDGGRGKRRPGYKRRSQVELDAANAQAEMDAVAPLAETCVTLMDVCCNAVASKVDAALPLTGKYADGATFKLSDGEKIALKEAAKIALAKMPGETLGKYAPWIAVAAVVAGVALPRYQMIKAVKALDHKVETPKTPESEKSGNPV